MKIFDKGDIKQNKMTVNIRREISIMKNLKHENIVGLKEVLSSQSKLYIVMDLVKGCELLEIIDGGNGLSEDIAQDYFQQLVDGVHYCHLRGVCHRDLKLENILVDEYGKVSIADFGIANMRGELRGGDDLMYTACGTPFYCAPEIINGALDGYSGYKIDAWSCGILLYLLLTGKFPFQNDGSNNMLALYERINCCEVNYPPWVSAEARDLISCLLAKDSKKRYSLEQVKSHPWFCINFESARSTSEENRENRTAGSRAESSYKTSRRRHSKSLPSPLGRESVPCHPQQSESSLILSPGFTDELSDRAHSQYSVGSACTVGSSAAVPTLKNTAQFHGIELIDFMKLALPGKPLSKLATVAEKMAGLDIDCTEDLLFLAENCATPESLSSWFEERSDLPSITCMRVGKFLFE